MKQDQNLKIQMVPQEQEKQQKEIKECERTVLLLASDRIALSLDPYHSTTSIDWPTN